MWCFAAPPALPCRVWLARRLPHHHETTPGQVQHHTTRHKRRVIAGPRAQRLATVVEPQGVGYRLCQFGRIGGREVWRGHDRFAPPSKSLVAVWVNPGALAHDAEHVRRQMQGGPCIEVKGDRAGFWEKHGLPSVLVPVDQMTAYRGDVPMKRRPISPNSACCIAVRNAPGDQWCLSNGVTLMVHGQRRGEGTRLFDGQLPLANWGPLASWTRGEVMRRVAFHGVPLPFQYAEGAPESFECGVCPANLDPGRLGFLKRFYPVEHAETLRLAGEVLDAAGAVLERERRALAAGA